MECQFVLELLTVVFFELPQITERGQIVDEPWAYKEKGIFMLPHCLYKFFVWVFQEVSLFVPKPFVSSSCLYTPRERSVKIDD